LAVFAALAELAVTELDQVDDDRIIGLDQVSRRLVWDLRIAERHSPLVADELPPLEVRERVTDILLAPRSSEPNIAWARRRHGHTENVAGHHGRRHLGGERSGGARRRRADRVAGRLNDQSHS